METGSTRIFFFSLPPPLLYTEVTLFGARGKKLSNFKVCSNTPQYSTFVKTHGTVNNFNYTVIWQDSICVGGVGSFYIQYTLLAYCHVLRRDCPLDTMKQD